jgi:hypothetical protein
MTGEQLKAAGIKLFGEQWQSPLAGRLGIDRIQIWRYVKNDRVPGPVAAAVECWLWCRASEERGREEQPRDRGL